MIRGVLFDIGGVLVSLDGVPALAKLLQVAESYDAIHDVWMSSAAVVAHETGRMSAPAFAERVVADLKLSVSPDSFLEEFRTWPRTVMPGAFELLDVIPSHYRVAALSNTSAVHWERIRSLGLAACFRRAYLSHEIGYMKPADEAFRFALDDMGLSPPQVVFLDDGVKNVAAAGALGLRAHVVTSPADAMTVLEGYGVVPAFSPR